MMKRSKVLKRTVSLLMAGLIVMTFFLPTLFPTKNLINKKSGYAVVIKQADNNDASDKTQNQSSVNLMEEEDEYTAENECDAEPRLPILITITFSSPNLFFKEHSSEVSGPPPWA